MPSATDFRNRTRREIAAAVSERPRTLYELSKALGKPPGSIAGLVRRMVDERLLDAEPDPPVQGTEYRLNAAAESALEEALGADRTPGRLRGGELLLLVEGDADGRLVYDVLSRRGLSASVGWAAMTERGGWLLALAPDGSPVQTERLRVALRRAGLSYAEWRVGHLMAPDEMRRVAAGLVDLGDEVAREAGAAADRRGGGARAPAH
jgi:hypothetical protein